MKYSNKETTYCYYSDSKKKRKLQDRLKQKQEVLNNAKGRREMAEDIATKKLVKRSQRVSQDVEGYVSAA